MARIRLVALDIDGTLLDSRNQLRPAVAAAVQRATERGVAVVLATGRWYESARRLADRLGLTTPVISHSGARVTRRAPGEEDLLHLTLPLEPARAIVAFMDKHAIPVNLTVGATTYIRPRPDLDPARLPEELRAEAVHLPYVTVPPTGALLFDREGIDRVHAAFAPRYGDVIAFQVNRTSGTSDHLTLHHPAVDKGRALLRVCEELGVPPEQTLAVGDAESDTAMFRVAGVAAAMGNALPEVRARATVVAPGNDEEGVAWVLARFALA
jgi:Cof subfamily protein (haloacid dehalogenase superfamily)